MTIEKGKPWGTPGSLPAGGMTVRTDAEASAVIESARRSGKPPPIIGLLGGDLGRTVGARGDMGRLRDGKGSVLPVDVGSAWLDGTQHWFVAHVIARRAWWWGRVVAIMNAEWLGRLDVAPRAHPNDGRLDILDARLPFAQRLRAARRLRSGTHLPHPMIEEHRVAAWHTRFEPALRVWVDGIAMGLVRDLSVRIEPDACTVVV